MGNRKIGLAVLLTLVGLLVAWVLPPPLLENIPLPVAAVRCVVDSSNVPPAPPGPDNRAANYLHTCGNRLYDQRGREVKITGVNWSGMEDSSFAPQGLSNRNWQDILDQVAGLGYNTIRLPFSNEALEPSRKVGGINFTLNPGLEGLTGLEMLDRLIAGARERGLKVILDRHFVKAGRLTRLWYAADVPEARWIADWRMLAARYKGNDTVIGVDLHNEPHGEATWGSEDPATDWRLAAERAGNAVLEANPYLLVFVQGIERYNGGYWWWGGDLQGARYAPVRLQVPNRLVYSPHDYGPAIQAQAWFADSRFPANLPGQWDRHWGYIQRQGIAPVVVGEFGGRSMGDDPDGQWQRTLLAYLAAHDIGALVWSLNPNWDTGGVLDDDWRTVESLKQDIYQQLLAPPIDLGALGIFGRAPPRFQLLFRQGQTEQANRVRFSVQIVNNSPETVDLSRFEARYWLVAKDPPVAGQQRPSDVTESPTEHVLVDLVPTNRGGQTHYVRIRFDQRAGTLSRYQGSREAIIGFRKSSQPGQPVSGDYSYASAPELHQRLGEWSQVTLYLDGRLVAGREP